MEENSDVDCTIVKSESSLGMILSKFLNPQIERVIERATESVNHPITAVELQGLPMRAYLEYSVVPVLVRGMQCLIKERYYCCYSTFTWRKFRPPKPIEYLAAFLMKNKDYPKEGIDK
ncbi:hypothetical protein FBUS_06303 [Fasciolopsis buskii]|uniref:Uncharacterized protein n=1 Tax=Fasciolopsis buskii TaxID=27845 RepID=A0A8E0S152_9TREM|nr:hypothetical protein FBUS_06303 [Fasciolopsis buski]